jgi:hypothetical protein
VSYEDFSSVASYTEAVTSVAQQLNDTGHHSDDELAVIILCGLQDSFDPLLISIAVN